MRVLFLDIDGVLTTPASIARANELKIADCFADHAIDRVNSILHSTGAELVIASDWRFLDDTDDILRAHGLREQHPDKLLRAIDDRMEAALEWIARHDVEEWCAIDDHGDNWRGRGNYLVKTSSRFGISPADERRALRLLASRSRAARRSLTAGTGDCSGSSPSGHPG